MSSSGVTVYKDSQTGQYYTLDRDGNRRPAAMQALPSRPRAINTASQLHSIAGSSPPTTQERRRSEVLPPNQPRTVNHRGPNVYPTELSSSYDSTARSDSTLGSPISQTPSNQWTPNTSPSVRSVQPYSPNYLTAVPASSIRSTNTSLPPYAFAAGTQQSGSTSLTPTSRTGNQAAQGSTGGDGGQGSHGDGDGQLPHRQDLDPSYKLRNKGFFTRGRVLLTLWSEPSGTSTSRRAPAPSSGARSSNRDVYTVAFRQLAFCKVRRFIIIAEGDRSCTALAISTHCGTGATHMQQDRSQYGLVYTGNAPPQILDSEHGMQAVAIRIDQDNATTPLDPMSRIHYGNLYTIEHNIRVKAYGMVNQASLMPLMTQFRQVNGERLGFPTPPLQTVREEWTPPDVTSGPGQTAQRPADMRQLLSPQYQRAMDRHPANTAAAPATMQAARSNAQNLARAPQPNPSGSSASPPSNNRRPAQLTVSDEDLRRRGFDEAQIRSIRNMIGRGLTAQYAMARTSALRQLRCTSEAAHRIAQAVQNGVSYESVVAQYRAREAQATQQRQSRDTSNE